MAERTQPLHIRALARALDGLRHLDITGTFHRAITSTRPFEELEAELAGGAPSAPTTSGGTQTRTIDSLVNGMLYYLEGNVERAEYHFRIAFDTDSPYVRTVGNNKRITIFDDRIRERMERLFRFLGGTPVGYTVSPDKVAVYEQMTAALRDAGYRVIPVLEGFSRIVVTMQTDDPTAEQYAVAHPEAAPRLLHGCVDAASWMHGHLLGIPTTDYACVPKLEEVLTATDEPLSPEGRTALEAFGDYFSRNAKTGFWDRCLSNHIVSTLPGESPAAAVRRWSEEPEFKRSFGITDFETCTDRTTFGHMLVDICYKTDADLDDDVVQSVRETLYGRAGVPDGRGRALEEVARLYRAQQYRHAFPRFMERATRRLATFYGADVVPTPLGWVQAWNRHADVIRHASR